MNPAILRCFSFLPFVCLLALSCIVLLDVQVVQVLESAGGVWWNNNAFWRFLTEAGDSTWWFLASGFGWLWCRYGKPLPVWRERCRQVFLAALVSGIALNLLKIVFARPRPRMLHRDGITAFDWFRAGSDYGSFPSGHTTTAFAVFVTLGVLFPRGRWVFIGVAVMTGLSRVMLGSHYPADVVAGAWVGVMVALVMRRCY